MIDIPRVSSVIAVGHGVLKFEIRSVRSVPCPWSCVLLLSASRSSLQLVRLVHLCRLDVWPSCFSCSIVPGKL
jgi:hypothetical protein